MRRTVAGALTLAAVFAATAPGAQAAKADTEVGFTEIYYMPEEQSQAVYLGPIESNKKACANKRKVTVYFEKSGKEEKIGSAKSQQEGDSYFWELGKNGAPKSGVYYAKASATDDCKGDKSPDYRYIAG